MNLQRSMVLVATSLIVALPAFSQGPAPANGGSGFDRLKGKYALTADQDKKLQDLSSQLFGQLKETMPTLDAKRMSILQGLTEAKIDTDKLTALQTELNTSTNNMANAVLQNQIKQMQVLTPEQRAQMRPGTAAAEPAPATNGK